MSDFGSVADWAAIGVAAVVGAAGGLVAWGSTRQAVKDMGKARDEDRDQHARDVKRLEDSVAKAESRANQALELAGDVKGIPGAIEAMGERLGGQIGHLAEVFGLRHSHLAGEVEELKAELRTKRRRRAPASGA
jgi:hypothetical protein